jgi:hypothetical protein
MICIGGSHMVCVLEAAQEEGSPLPAIALRAPAFEHISEARVVAAAEDLDPEEVNRHGAPLFCFVGGIRYLSLGALGHPRPFDFVLPSAPELPLDPNAELVPSSALRARMAKDDKRHLDMLDRIGEIADGPIYQFETPPPPPQEWLERKRARRTANGDSDLPPPYVRLKLWRLYSDILRDAAERAGAHFVARPDAAVDETGFLRDGLSRNATHANAQYGALVLRQLRSLASAAS